MSGMDMEHWSVTTLYSIASMLGVA